MKELVKKTCSTKLVCRFVRIHINFLTLFQILEISFFRFEKTIKSHEISKWFRKKIREVSG